jgi:hypothetical protein
MGPPVRKLSVWTGAGRGRCNKRAAPRVCIMEGAVAWPNGGQLSLSTFF